MASLGKLEGLIPITAIQTMTCTETTPNTGSTAVTVAVADYYLTSTTSLLAAVKNALDTISGNSTYTVTLDDDNDDTSTGKVTISATGIVSFQITWTTTALRDILGFTGTITGAATYTAPNQAKYLHLPDVGRSEMQMPLGVDRPIRDSNIVFTPGSDTSYGMSFATRNVNRFALHNMLGSKTWTTLEVVVNEALQTFWTDVIAKTYPVRWHADRNDDATYLPWRILRSNDFAPEPVVGGWVGAKSLWRYGSDVIKYS